MLIVKALGIVTVTSIVVSLLLPKYYQSTTTLLPGEEQPGISALAGLSNLASITGISVGKSSLEELYPDIILSESVLKEVIEQKYKSEEFEHQVNLIEYWEIDEDTPLEGYESALEKLRKELEVNYERRKGLVTVSLLMKEPQLAADVVNYLVKQLDEFIRTKRTTNASERRRWIEARLQEVDSDLERSEDSLKTFREKNRRVEGSPQLLLEQGRLLRKVTINSAIYEELKKQYEIAKIEEIKNVPIINIMDAARPAAQKEKPKRRLIVVSSFLLALVGAVGYVVVREFYWADVKSLLSRIMKSGNGTG